MATAVRSSKCSSATKPGDPSPVDLNAAGSNGQGVGFTSSVERADVFAGVSAVVDLLAPSLQPSAGGAGSITITDGGTGFSVGHVGFIIQPDPPSNYEAATFKVTHISGEHTGPATAVEVTSFGSGYTPGSTVSLSGGSGTTNATGKVHSPMHNKKVTLEVFLSPVDCTDSDKFPGQPNTAKGGGLVPTATQLSTHFHKQFVNPVSLTYLDNLDRRQSIAVCVVSQTYLCVQASVEPDPGGGTRYSTTSTPSVPSDTFQILARVESYLFPTSIPLLDSDNGNANSNPATEQTLVAVSEELKLVSDCVDSSVLKVSVENGAAEAHSVTLVEGGNDVSSSNPLSVAPMGNTEADGSGTARHLHVDGTGNLMTQIVSTVNITPANNHGSNALPVAISAATATVGTKLEDLSSSVDADHQSGTGRSVAVGLKAKTDIANTNTGTFLKCTSDGHLVVEIDNAPTITHDGLARLSRAIVGDDGSEGSGVLQVGGKPAVGYYTSASFADGDVSDAIDVRDHKSVRLIGQFARVFQTNDWANSFRLEQSNDNSNWSGQQTVHLSSADEHPIGSDNYRTFSMLIEGCSNYIRYVNKSNVTMAGLRLDWRLFS